VTIIMNINLKGWGCSLF